MRSFLLSILLLTLATSYAQTDPLAGCRGIPKTNIGVSIAGKPVMNTRFGIDTALLLELKPEVVSGGFRLTVPDKSYTILGFRLYYLGVNSDLYYKDIIGDTATPEQVPPLKSVMAGESIEIRCIRVRKKGKSCVAYPLLASIVQP